MLSISLSDEQAQLLDHILRRMRLIDLNEADNCPHETIKYFFERRARRIENLLEALECALPEPEHR